MPVTLWLTVVLPNYLERFGETERSEGERGEWNGWKMKERLRGREGEK